MEEIEKKRMKSEVDRERIENLSSEIYPVFANIFALAIHLKRDIYADIRHYADSGNKRFSHLSHFSLLLTFSLP